MRSTATLAAMVQMPDLRELSSWILTLQSHDTIPSMYGQSVPLVPRPANASPSAKVGDDENGASIVIVKAINTAQAVIVFLIALFIFVKTLLAILIVAYYFKKTKFGDYDSFAV